jgi:hypothetical protein
VSGFFIADLQVGKADPVPALLFIWKHIFLFFRQYIFSSSGSTFQKQELRKAAGTGSTFPTCKSVV